MQPDLRKTHSTVYNPKPDAEVTSYPSFNYLLALLFLVCFIYLIYSVHGGANSIPGFNQQYITLTQTMVAVFTVDNPSNYCPAANSSLRNRKSNRDARSDYF